MNRLDTVTRIGLDGHGGFRATPFRDRNDRVVTRERVEHVQRGVLHAKCIADRRARRRFRTPRSTGLDVL